MRLSHQYGMFASVANLRSVEPTEVADDLDSLPDYDADAEAEAGLEGASATTTVDLPRSSERLIAELAVDAALPAPVRRALLEGRPNVILVLVPGGAWCARVFEAIAALAPGWNVASIIASARPRPGTSEIARVSASTPTVAVTADIAWLSPVVVAAADVVITVRAPAPDLVAEAVKRWCGARRCVRVTAADIAGLDLPDLAAGLRRGASQRACINRLQRASAARIRPAEPIDAPDLTTLVGYGEAHTWAVQTVHAIRRVAAGAASAQTLESAILHGPPGTGKTTLARAIAAAAGVPYLQTSIAQLFSSSSGNLDGVIKAFDQYCDRLLLARDTLNSGTAIGFIDELDALPDRATLSPRGADWWLPVITSVLMRVEALRREGVVLLAATNHLERIDSALRRPGRFDRSLFIGLPDEAARACIFRQHLGGDLPDADDELLARLSHGATGAQIAGFVRGARARAGERPVTVDDLLAEVAPPDQRDPAALRAIALHEAGHAVVALALGLAVSQVSIVASTGAEGVTTISFADALPSRTALDRRVIALLAGRATDVVLGAGATAGAASDLSEATRTIAASHAALGLAGPLVVRSNTAAIQSLVRDDPDLAARVDGELHRLMEQAEAIVRARRDSIRAVAEALLSRRALTGSEAEAIAAAHKPRIRVRARSSL
ncbi:AAA family ATPase [Salinarimonas ramus]|uniref:AAA+ ATPase domain-containing protein n=1 Tax=Salinarimonas ramus TaxID=690164 RepID=A0A917V8M5_9HYPH|nr:AAA family ATPase [Salinarimonas ramus]GGK51772.1 hypothetical protein GCM10011322_43510 [Salinarimonas ramus]